MDNWKIQFMVVTFVVVLQTYEAASSAVAEEGWQPEHWQHESGEEDLSHQMANLMKRAKALRFYGLMGKRSGLKKPFQVNRRNKGETFVGLMGRSLSSSGQLQNLKKTRQSFNRINPYATSSPIEVLEKPQNQGSSEEWIQILY